MALFPAQNPYPALRVDWAGIIIYANAASQSLLRDYSSAVGELIPAAWRSPLEVAFSHDLEQVFEIDHRGRTYSVSVVPLREERYANLYASDVTERKRAQQEAQKLSNALEQAADLVMITNTRGIIEYVNTAFVEVTGYHKEEVIGAKASVLSSGLQDAEFYAEMWKTVQAGDVFRDLVINRKKNGELYYEEKTITPLKDSAGTITHFISTARDVTEYRQVQERLYHLRYYDVLTELPNRDMFLKHLDKTLEPPGLVSQSRTVLCVGMDRFKFINETLGHEVGDSLLQACTQRIKAQTCAEDFVARLGNDEFGIVLSGSPLIDSIAPLVRKLLEAFSQPFHLADRELTVTIAIGISCSPDDGTDAQSLLKNADTAMSRARELGRSKSQFFTPDMNARAFERLTLESGLRRALEREEFFLHFQPQIDLARGEITGVEALVRWQHPELGLISPMEFIPLLEETGLIVPVGEWILRTACIRNRAWQEEGLPPLVMAVNFSALQLRQENLAERVSDVLRSTKLEPQWLEIELTESTVMEDGESSITVLQDLQAVGVRLAIDDFGTGYSSLSYLRRFPVDTLKIDRSFILDINTDPGAAEITQVIIAMAGSLGLRVIAEGVETHAQLEFLRQRSCDLVQGYLFSRPLPPDELAQLLRNSDAPVPCPVDDIATPHTKSSRVVLDILQS
ncbi:diguanylate cyclase/phosphodiesterase (GGDEF & EAL domains) with PAS/PAC sensor(s) [hydrothermal vent metagenome]|uniref:Diguanylate cyclase/phosphodiesterase (GGDEF & EAL domains) with PAS/PAC sensor(S) n=1 Tax=hydrothermal vent metagenome TaxID=652676 RepID=A0A3B0Y4F7_9ZZZZ